MQGNELRSNGGLKILGSSQRSHDMKVVMKDLDRKMRMARNPKFNSLDLTGHSKNMSSDFSTVDKTLNSSKFTQITAQVTPLKNAGVKILEGQSFLKNKNDVSNFTPNKEVSMIESNHSLPVAESFASYSSLKKLYYTAKQSMAPKIVYDKKIDHDLTKKMDSLEKMIINFEVKSKKDPETEKILAEIDKVRASRHQMINFKDPNV
jgi:hypothetical protein